MRDIQAIQAVESSEIEVDCGGVTESDSAGLAVLLDWLAHARNRKVPLRFVELPDRLFALSPDQRDRGPARPAALTGAVIPPRARLRETPREVPLRPRRR